MFLSDRRIDTLLDLIKQAGRAVQTVYDNPMGSQIVSHKADSSPLTEADRIAHRILVTGLREQSPVVLPVLSEEGELPPYTERSTWFSYWLIDPLDGTKEFVERTGDFTVNVALIIEGRPVWGAVYAPVFSTLYWGSKEGGAFKQIADEAPITIRVQQPFLSPVRILGSRRHGDSPEKQKGLPPLDSICFRAVGSSLKFCLLAEGGADLYARLGPTSEWDTAAGQAVLEAAGGIVVDLKGQPVHYNRQADIVQPSFIAMGDRSLLPAAMATFNVHK